MIRPTRRGATGKSRGLPVLQLADMLLTQRDCSTKEGDNGATRWGILVGRCRNIGKRQAFGFARAIHYNHNKKALY